jgi:ABC-2 type transport system permease protein
VVPIAGSALLWVGADALPRGAAAWAMTLAAVLGGWLLTLLVNLAIGCLSFFTESSVKVMDLYLVLFIVMSGYTIPVELFPAQLRRASDLLPFRYQVGLPVELLTSAHPPAEALALLAAQWGYVALMLLVTASLWKRGVARFEAYGG